MNRCALFLDADPLSKKEIQAVKQVEKIYGEADIFLERRAQTRKSQLSYDEKVDIIKRDISQDECNYRVFPIDVSKYDALKREGIANIAMIVSASSDMKKVNEQMAMYFQLIDNCSVILVPVKQKVDVSPKFIWQLVLDDASKAICRKYISDCAYFKVKSKLVKKVFIERPSQFKAAVSKVFEDRQQDFELLNIDLYHEDEAYAKLAQAIMKTQKRCIAVCMPQGNASSLNSLADINIKFGKQDKCLCIDGKTNEEVSRSLINVLNGKLKKACSLEFI